MKIARLLSLLAIISLAFTACGDDDDDNNNSGPHCVDLPATCDPVCDALTQWCDGTTCMDNVACDPACATDGTEYCDTTTGTCTAVPAACDPACATDGTEYCDDGTCMDMPVTPVCDPGCTTEEMCVE